MEDLSKIKDFCLELIEKWHENDVYMPNINKNVLGVVTNLVRYNYELWHEEDKARDPDASDSVIADVKRRIDKLNQKRNDTIEKLDEILYNYFKEVPKVDNATMNSETPGSIIDRISINSLKIYHMREQTLREDVSKEHIENCQYKLSILLEQAEDLQKCLNELLDDLATGKKYMKVYRQMKMYNDPNLNPILYSKKEKG